MPRPKRYRHPEDFRRVTLTQVAREFGMPRRRTEKVLKGIQRYVDLKPRIRPDKRAEITYDAAAIEVVKALQGLPHRTIPGASDWLRAYQGEKHV